MARKLLWDISLCQLSDDPFKLWKRWHEIGCMCVEFPISLIYFVPFCPKIYLNLLKSKMSMCCSSTYKYSWNRSMKIQSRPFPLCWVTHHKTNYGLEKFKSLWGGHGKNGNILSTPKEIPINISSHIIPRSSAPGRHHIILLANHHQATLFLEL